MNTQDQHFTGTVLHTPFFADFMVFLRTLQERPLMLTKTGNLQRKEIAYFGKHFKIDIYQRDDKGAIIYPIYTENEVPHLQKIRLISRVMHLTYQRKGQLHLSSNGKRFVQHLDPQTQFEHMVLCSFRQCHWADLYPYLEHLASLLQKNQQSVWMCFLQNQTKPLDCKHFVEGLRTTLNLKNENPYHNRVKWAIETIFVKDLALCGLVEYQAKKEKYTEEVLFLQPTPLGLHMFQKAVSEPLNS